jgi:hypothetical protein
MFFPPQALEIVGKLIPLFTILLQGVFGPLYFLLLVAVFHFVSALFGEMAEPQAWVQLWVMPLSPI